VTASTGALDLDNAGDTVTVTAGAYSDTWTFGNEGNQEQSVNRDPDLSENALDLHTTVPGAVGDFSPGLRVDLTSF
jgi:hypothetical protein